MSTAYDDLNSIGAQRLHGGSSIEPGPSAFDKFTEAAVDGLLWRAGRTSVVSTAARALQYDSLGELARKWCGLRGLPAPADAEALAGILLGADIPHGTPGDFPNILSVLANKVLEPAPSYVATTFRAWTFRLPSVRDFKPATVARVSEFGELPYHHDGADFEQSRLREGMSWFQVGSYGDEFSLTPKMIVDDDLGAFVQALADKETAHDMTLNRLCVTLLVNNVVLSDGYALFDTANHGNNAASGAVPSETTLSAARLALRKQTGMNGRKLGLPLSLIIAPEELETTLDKLLKVTLRVAPTSDVAITNVTSGANVFRGEVNHLIEPMLTSTTGWYAFAPPAAAHSICHCFQQGFERMVQRSYYNPKNNCRTWQFEGRFAAVASNHLGVYRNVGV